MVVDIVPIRRATIQARTQAVLILRFHQDMSTQFSTRFLRGSTTILSELKVKVSLDARKCSWDTDTTAVNNKAQWDISKSTRF